jgi:hypothetical protein
MEVQVRIVGSAVALLVVLLLTVTPAGSVTTDISGVAATRAGHHQKIYGVENCGTPAVEPDRIVFADFGLYANHFDWDHWGHRKTTANAVLHAKVCKPDCASRYFEDYPVEITLHKIKTWSCNGFRARFYRKVKMSSLAVGPRGSSPTFRASSTASDGPADHAIAPRGSRCDAGVVSYRRPGCGRKVQWLLHLRGSRRSRLQLPSRGT